MELGVRGRPFAPHLSFGKLEALKVIAPSSALPSFLMMPLKCTKRQFFFR